MMTRYFAFVTGLMMVAINGYSQHNFDPSKFKRPDLEFGPFTRWWWPGNAVNAKELKREVELFSKNMFGGVEIQPLTVGINPDGTRHDQVYSWDTPSFYRNVSAVMETALQTGLTVDINGGSGWPLGGPFLQPQESMLSLEAADTTVAGGQSIDFTIPRLKSDNSKLRRNNLPIYNEVDLGLARLISLVAVRTAGGGKEKPTLDPRSVVSLKAYIKDGHLNWKVPVGGVWKIIAFYAVPNGEKPLYVASKKTSWVTDHFDSAAVQKSYEYLFGTRTGLDRFYGKPFRAVFNDSKEFIVSRHVSNDFDVEFKKRRGYDVELALLANLIPGYNNAYSFGKDTVPDYTMSAQDWRLRYDYNLTLTELYKERFLKSSMNWLEPRKLQYRGQEYGLRTDVIATSGMVSIPETEQLSGNGSEGFVRLVSAGAHLYNRPVVAQESFVFSHRAGMTTPQKIKAFSNKSFAAGINQIVYHGSPYKYQTGQYGAEGWTAWSTPFRPFNYSSNINEAYNHWGYIREINTFLARSQYALRAGKAKADVLIYFPFIDFESSQMVSNPEETFISGYFGPIEPVGPDLKKIKGTPTLIQQWFLDVWPLVNKLESLGLTWDYVNDESLELASQTGTGIAIRGNVYTALVLANVPYMPVKIASKLKSLTNSGADLLIYGTAPNRQPGYADYQSQDNKIKDCFEQMRSSKVKRYARLEELEDWARSLGGRLEFSKPYTFLKMQKRELPDGNILYYLWNKTAEEQQVLLNMPGDKPIGYLLSPEDGKIVKNDGQKVTAVLSPYSAIFLLCAKNSVFPDGMLGKADRQYTEKTVAEILSWDLQVGKHRVGDTALFDWRTSERFKYLSDPGVYTSSFSLKPATGKGYRLELGDVFFTAEIFINGKKAGTSLWPPYQADISGLLSSGSNVVKVVVTPSDRNYYVGEGVSGNPKYTQYKHLGKTLLPAGMLGPVRIKEYPVQ